MSFMHISNTVWMKGLDLCLVKTYLCIIADPAGTGGLQLDLVRGQENRTEAEGI